MARNRLTIELSQAQIHRVLREAGNAGLLSLIGGVDAVAGLEEVKFLASLAESNNPRFSVSVLRGLMVLVSFPADGAGRTLSDVADELGFGLSTTHRYASTLLEVGLLERDPVSREYRRAVGD